MESHASFWEAVRGAAASLRSSKLRSFLTLLGIILATTTLIAVMSVIEGMNRYIAENVSQMGVDGFKVRRIIFLNNWDPKKYLEMLRRNPLLNKDEYEFIKAHSRLVREVGLTAGRDASVHYGSTSVDWVNLQGVSANMGVIDNTQIAIGRYISDFENQRRLSVCVIGNDIKEKFFPSQNPIDKTILVRGKPFQVIGVAKAKGSVFGESQDLFVMIPIETYFKMNGARQGMGYEFKAIDRNHLAQAEEEVKSLLRAYRHLKPKDEDTFAIVASDSLVGAWDQMTGAIAATALAIVSVFLVVGGVVIMNIMLAVVTERTHEIGIRKSVGARRSDILQQFLVESSMLAASGGVAGVLFAWVIGVAVRTFASVPMSMPIMAVVIGVTLSAAVGLFFGIYPASRASKLDPIEALRFEK